MLCVFKVETCVLPLSMGLCNDRFSVIAKSFDDAVAKAKRRMKRLKTPRERIRSVELTETIEEA